MMTQDDLNRCEEIIRADRSSFDEIGKALLKIKDEHGYICANYGSFFDYCTMRLGIGYRHVDRLIRAAQIAETLQPTDVLPQHERQVRPLASLEPARQREVWIRAIQESENGRVTHKSVERIVKELSQ